MRTGAELKERFLFNLPIFSHFTVRSRKQLLEIYTTALVQQNRVDVRLFRVDVKTGPDFRMGKQG